MTVTASSAPRRALRLAPPRTWREQARYAITDLEGLERSLVLTESEREGVRRALASGLPLSITPYYLALCDRLRLVERATSLGGTRTKTSHAATTTHRQLDDAALLAAGIDPGAVRVSVGLEDADDLVEDLVQALDGL